MILLFIGFWSIGFLCSTGFWVWRFLGILKSYERERNEFIKTIGKLKETESYSIMKSLREARLNEKQKEV